MNMAQSLVAVSKSLSDKIRMRQGEISTDEVNCALLSLDAEQTVTLKSHLLSLGVADPVTKATFTSTSNFYAQLATELVAVLMQPISEQGGACADQ